MWKDEWQAWFLSRDLNLFELLDFLYYEGHPGLWYLYLKPFTILWSSGILGLKIAHGLIFVLAVWLLFKLDAPLWLKVAIAMSYAFGFEYAVVSRGYIFVITLGLVGVHYLKRGQGYEWPMAMVIFLLCQSEVQGVLLSCAFVIYLWFEKSSRKDLISPMAGLLAGALCFVLSVYPRKSTDELSFAYAGEFLSADNWMKAFQGISTNAILPGILPDTNVFGVSGLGILLGVVVLSVIFYIFRNHRSVLLFFFSFWMASMLFHSMIYPGGLRQWSVVAIVFMLALLLKSKNEPNRITRFLTVLVLLPGVMYGLRAHYKDLTMPFTNAKDAGQFIHQKVPSNVPVVAINKFECAPVGGYAERGLYALPDGNPFSYFKWVEKVYLPSEEELMLFAEYKKVGGIIILSPSLLNADRYPNAKLWQTFETPNLKRENYALYTLSRNQ